MSQLKDLGKLTLHEVRTIGYCFEEMMRFITEEHAERERVAEHFAYGDIGEAFKYIMQEGLLHYSELCDMDDTVGLVGMEVKDGKVRKI